MRKASFIILTLLPLLSSSLLLAQSVHEKDNTRTEIHTRITELENTMIENAIKSPNGKIRCFSTEYENIRKELNPDLQTRDEFESWMSEELKKNKQHGRTKATRVIPVVVHVLYFSVVQNISMAQIQSQIDILTQDFTRTNPDAGSTPASFLPDAADCDIEFCLAQVDPNGQPTDGVNRVNVGVNSLTMADMETTWKANTIWDPTKYFNIWVGNFQGNFLGYAQFPEAATLPGIGQGNGSADTDGIAIQYYAFGNVGAAAPPNAQGRTTTHEVGHWLGLRHIWGDGDCNVDDFCLDTPFCEFPHFNCTSTTTCGSVDMIQNYMDYTDDNCLNLFTLHQKLRMDVVLGSSIRRASLLTSNVCSTVSVNEFSEGLEIVNVYPNPSTGYINVFSTKKAVTNVAIVNAIGEVVMQLPVDAKNELKIDLSDQPKGIYFVKVTSDNLVTTRRVLLTK